MVSPSSDGSWRSEPGASEGALDGLRRASPIPLPESYVGYLRTSNGGEGEIAVDPGWIVFWRAEEVLENNNGYEVEKCVPGLFGFGSNGGGDLLAFDTRGGAPYPIVTVPFVGMEPEQAVMIATDFEDLLRHIRRTRDTL